MNCYYIETTSSLKFQRAVQKKKKKNWKSLACDERETSTIPSICVGSEGSEHIQIIRTALDEKKIQLNGK